MKFHLAQAHAGVAKYRCKATGFTEFPGNPGRINALAGSSPGFVWRYVVEWFEPMDGPIQAAWPVTETAGG